MSVRSAKCRAMTKAGKRCSAYATKGGLCFFHANPNKAAELGRIGGRKNHHVSMDNLDPLPSLLTATAVRDAGARLIHDVHSGQVDPRIAASLAPLLSLQLRSVEAADNAELRALIAEFHKKLELVETQLKKIGITEQTEKSERQPTW